MDIDNLPESAAINIGKGYAKKYGIKKPQKKIDKPLIKFKNMDEAKKWWNKNKDRVDKGNLPEFRLRTVKKGNVRGTYKKMNMSQLKKAGIYDPSAAAKAGKTLHIKDMYVQIPGIAELKHITAKQRLDLVIKQNLNAGDFTFIKMQTPSGQWRNVNPYTIQKIRNKVQGIKQIKADKVKAIRTKGRQSLQRLARKESRINDLRKELEMKKKEISKLMRELKAMEKKVKGKK